MAMKIQIDVQLTTLYVSRNVILVIIHSEYNTRLNGAVQAGGNALGSRGYRAEN